MRDLTKQELETVDKIIDALIGCSFDQAKTILKFVLSRLRERAVIN